MSNPSAVAAHQESSETRDRVEICQRLGVEWAYRMMSDPKRLIPRYADNAWFLGTALVSDWQRQVVRWGMWGE